MTTRSGRLRVRRITAGRPCPGVGRREQALEASPEWIASHLLPPISPAEATRALVTLEQLGMLQRAEDGTFVPIDAVVTTGPETRGLQVRNYHRAMLERAGAVMELVPAADRDISSLTFAATEQALHEVKRRVQAFRRELISYVSELPGDRVIQLNFQLFPLSRSDP